MDLLAEEQPYSGIDSGGGRKARAEVKPASWLSAWLRQRTLIERAGRQAKSVVNHADLWWVSPVVPQPPRQ